MTTDLPRVLTLEQARAHGFSDKAVRHRLNTGRWQRPFPRVYATFSGPIDTESMLMAALAYAGKGAALSHDTAAARLRFSASKRPIHITVPETRRVAKQPGLIIHYSRRNEPREIRNYKGLPCTTVDRTVLDLVDAAPTAGKAAGILADAVGSRRTTSSRLRQAVVGWPNLKHRAAVLAMLEDTERGAHSRLELEHAGVLRRHGLPPGQRQKRDVLNGRVSYIDNVIEPYGVITELDGLDAHSKADDRVRDMDRDNANVVRGKAPLRYGWEGVLDRGCHLAAQTATVLEQRGWTGRLLPCGPKCTAGAERERPLEGGSATQPRLAS